MFQQISDYLYRKDKEIPNEGKKSCSREVFSKVCLAEIHSLSQPRKEIDAQYFN